MNNSSIYAIVNQKGGVGKTTTAVNLATALAAVKKKILLIDLDPQGNASTGLGIDRSLRKVTSYDLLLQQEPWDAAINKTRVPSLDVIPATVDLSAAELELASERGRNFLLKKNFDTVSSAGDVLTDRYDYILIDCPPSLGVLTLNALVVSRHILVPLQCEFYALEGLSHLMHTIQLVKKKLNPDLEIEGVILTMVDRRNRLTRQVEHEVRGYMPEKIYQESIPRNVRISEAPSHGLPAMLYDYKSPGAQAYIRVAKEFLKRQKLQHTVAA